MIDGRYVFPDDLVFARCYYQADNDLSDESYKNGLTKMVNTNTVGQEYPVYPKMPFIVIEQMWIQRPKIG